MVERHAGQDDKLLKPDGDLSMGSLSGQIDLSRCVMCGVGPETG